MRVSVEKRAYQLLQRGLERHVKSVAKRDNQGKTSVRTFSIGLLNGEGDVDRPIYDITLSDHLIKIVGRRAIYEDNESFGRAYERILRYLS